MKSLIIKDLYNISHNAKSMFLMLLVMAVIAIPIYGAESYIIISGVLSSMMIVTTFNFDDNSKWTTYALIMPLSRKDIVISKFIVLFFFCIAGVACGFVIGIIGGLITQKLTFDLTSIAILFFMCLVSLVISEILGSISIPLVFKYGAEKGRMLLLISVIIPAGIGFLLYKLIQLLGIAITDQFIFILICVSPLIALLWNYIMFKISYFVFSRQEM